MVRELDPTHVARPRLANLPRLCACTTALVVAALVGSACGVVWDAPTVRVVVAGEQVLIATLGLAGVFGPLWEPTVWANAQGITSFSPLAARAALVVNVSGEFGFDREYADINENVDPVEATWEFLGHSDDINTAAGTSVHNVYHGLSVLALGVLNAGDELTATSWADCLYSTSIGEPNRCDQGRFNGGRDWHYVPNVSYGAGDYGGPFSEFTTIYRVSEETDVGLPGYYESFDNYQYVQSMDELPDEPSHDTGATPPDIPHQEEVGLRPWTTCEEVGLD